MRAARPAAGAGRQRPDVGARALQPSAQHVRAARAQQGERGRVFHPEIVVLAVIDDLLAQRRVGLLLRDGDPAIAQLLDEARCRGLEFDERPERVERDHATQCHVAKTPV